MRELPAKRMGALVLVWIALIGLNYVLIRTGLNPGTPITFPISVFVGPRLSLPGLPFTALFVVVFFLAAAYRRRLGVGGVWAIGLLLILLGNLAQGGLDAGLYAPFTESGIQYYHDAIQVSDWQSWLSDFNARQPALLLHSKTHPPFAVLIHSLLLGAGKQNLLVLALSFLVLSSGTIILVYHIIHQVSASRPKALQIALLFAVIPAFNIYAAVSLDGVIAFTATVFLLGMVRILIKHSLDWVGLVLLVAGLVLTNALTFGGFFLIALAALASFHQIIYRKSWYLAIALFLGLLALIIAHVSLWRIFGYNHLEAFATASRLENPGGFQGIADPLHYVMTRIEGIAEIALFLSLGILATLVDVGFLRRYARRVTLSFIFFAAMMGLVFLLLLGVYKTGETARAMLFIYPYFMLPLAILKEHKLMPLLVIAGLQTILMQTLGGYFW